MNDEITEQKAKKKLKSLFMGNTLDGSIEAAKCKDLTEFTEKESDKE